MTVYKSTEDYLETILILQKRRGQVRSIDIAHERNVTKATVSITMKRLREHDYIQMDSDGYITLQPRGLDIAQRIYARHCLLSQFLEGLGVSQETASADACRLEHDLSEEAFEKLSDFAQRHNLVEQAEEPV